MHNMHIKLEVRNATHIILYASTHLPKSTLSSAKSFHPLAAGGRARGQGDERAEGQAHGGPGDLGVLHAVRVDLGGADSGQKLVTKSWATRQKWCEKWATVVHSPTGQRCVH